MRNDKSTRRPLPLVNKKKLAHGRGHPDACQIIHTHARLVVNWQTPQPRSRRGPESRGIGGGGGAVYSIYHHVADRQTNHHPLSLTQPHQIRNFG